MATTHTITHSEILQMADAVSQEKGLDKDVIFSAIEAALATATRKRHDDDIDARVSIHQDSGEYDSFRVWEVVEDDDEFEFPDRQIKLSDARKRQPDIEVGGFVEEPMDNVEFGRIAAQAAKQVIMQKVREAVREQTAERYKDQRGVLISGTVKRLDRGNAIIDLGDSEALLPKSGMIPREGLRPGDRIRALLQDIDTEARGPQLILTRLTPEFLIALFKLEVPEVSEGIIDILSAARDPGSRAKISVRTNDPNVDPVGACVGIRGSRVQSVSNEIAGERVDIIVWSSNHAEFVIQALAPAEVEFIYIDEDLQSMDVVVTEENLSRAIGRGGQNVRLASELTGWELNLMTDQDAAEKQENEQQALIQDFMQRLDLDQNVASILAQEGFHSLEEIAYVPKQELLDIEEFDEALVDELRSRAQDTLLTSAIASQEEKEPEEALLGMEGMDEETAHALAGGGVRSIEDLADCSVDEVLDIVDIDRERAGALIMTARAPLFSAAAAE
ncbi:MAG: transcription termination factor NusA [Gammaproteobacteria bacterium]|nr:transcription termination factor NusA [Gammaproteobacteria bacterium]MDD9884176.1 transcription termination factor NusA [Gammaproteobacteria bacterium]